LAAKIGFSGKFASVYKYLVLSLKRYGGWTRRQPSVLFCQMANTNGGTRWGNNNSDFCEITAVYDTITVTPILAILPFSQSACTQLHRRQKVGRKIGRLAFSDNCK